VNAHLPAIECVRSLTARRLAHNQLQNLSRHADRTFDLQQFNSKVINHIKITSNVIFISKIVIFVI
jgi:hypothetical protein